MGKVLLVLYDGGQHAKDQPGLLGTTENELGLRKWLEEKGHTLVTTSDKEGANSKFDQELVDAEVIITTPFHPGYLTAERLAKAKNLKLAVTAGVGSDHVDLNAANKTNGGITVAEVTGCNVVSVAEHVVMTILVLVRNFVPSHEQVASGDWNVAAVAKNEYDLEGKVVGTVAVGRIGERVLRRLKPFDCKELLYYDYQPLTPEVEKEIGCRRVENLEEMLAQCDVVTINCPLHEKTRGLFNKDLISKMKKRLLAHQHRPRRHRRQRRRRRRHQIRPSARLRRRRVVPAARAQGPSAALRPGALGRRKRDGAAHVRQLHRCAGALRGGHEGDSRVVFLRQA
ncbi:formate dehydrogenase [Blastomyces gilchristii SLH14081]|uniref:Formate dehydrogenase n=1 Tax=Blastomyces gilchristii (strain SLH14081) TaxID=559298 RepID=A0A179UWZ8_BLAGS|nr:formate dehydrogenase [Blastomyces gilchristii SLH14081]OAT12333.1 formate dehydrogenase [Blastomyces gilchristii SLH14081]